MKEKKYWILAFLYSQGITDKIGEPINASLRLMKDLFLLWKEKGTLTNLYADFKAYNYGPCDFNVYTGIDELKAEGLIEEVRTERNYLQLILTQRGISFTESIFNQLEDDVKDKIKEIKKETNSRKSLIELLKFIYGKYPEWAINSLIKLS